MNKSFYLLLILSVSFASALITTDDDDDDFSDVNQNTSKLFNISVNSSYLGNTTDIIRVEVTIPSSFSFVSGSNGTTSNSAVYFLNQSNRLVWNSSLLVQNNSREYFWFRAISSNSDGDYEINVRSQNSTSTFEYTNLTVEVLDSTPPKITINSPESKTYNLEFILINITINEVGSCHYSADGGLSNVSLKSYGSRNFAKNSSFDDGKVDLDIYCRDNSDNWNHSLIGFRVVYTDSPTNTSTNNVSLPPKPANNTVPQNRTNVSSTTNSSQKFNTPSGTIVKNESSPIVKWSVVIGMALIGIVLLIIAIAKSKQGEY